MEFPKTLFASFENEDEPENAYVTTSTIASHVVPSVDGTYQVGLYEFKGLVTVKTTTTISETTPPDAAQPQP